MYCKVGCNFIEVQLILFLPCFDLQLCPVAQLLGSNSPPLLMSLLSLAVGLLLSSLISFVLVRLNDDAAIFDVLFVCPCC